MKYVYMLTTGPELPGRCAMPFQLATAAALVGNEATVVLSGTGVSLVEQGVADRFLPAPGMPPLRHFIDQARESGVALLICSGGLDVTGLKQENLALHLDGIIGGMTFNEMAAESDVVMVF
ncbi:MAG TPA: DsrE family protein [Symbiobacteriaceae bacterium]|nr:DsrE family protein [Symbiobacteriaceae bacterium]